MTRFRSALLAVALAGVSVQATVLVPADITELAREARLIALGRVVATEGVSSGDWRTIETVVTLETEAAIKGGSDGSLVQFRVPGGQVGRYRRVFVGAPVFVPGQRVVVFLGQQGASLPHILGLSQGVFRVVPSANGWVVTPPALLVDGPLPQAIRRGDPGRRVLSLEDFTERVRALAEGAR